MKRKQEWVELCNVGAESQIRFIEQTKVDLKKQFEDYCHRVARDMTFKLRKQTGCQLVSVIYAPYIPGALSSKQFGILFNNILQLFFDVFSIQIYVEWISGKPSQLLANLAHKNTNLTIENNIMHQCGADVVNAIADLIVFARTANLNNFNDLVRADFRRYIKYPISDTKHVCRMLIHMWRKQSIPFDIIHKIVVIVWNSIDYDIACEENAKETAAKVVKVYQVYPGREHGPN